MPSACCSRSCPATRTGAALTWVVPPARSGKLRQAHVVCRRGTDDMAAPAHVSLREMDCAARYWQCGASLPGWQQNDDCGWKFVPHTTGLLLPIQQPCNSRCRTATSSCQQLTVQVRKDSIKVGSYVCGGPPAAGQRHGRGRGRSSNGGKRVLVCGVVVMLVGLLFGDEGAAPPETTQAGWQGSVMTAAQADASACAAAPVADFRAPSPGVDDACGGQRHAGAGSAGRVLC